jgi:hypothetical protein
MTILRELFYVASSYQALLSEGVALPNPHSVMGMAKLMAISYDLSFYTSKWKTENKNKIIQ